MLNWCPQFHQREHRKKQKSQRSKKGLSKCVVFPSVSQIKKKISSYRNVRERQQMKNTFLISSPHLRLTNVQMQLSDSKLTFLCKQKKGVFFHPTQASSCTCCWIAVEGVFSSGVQGTQGKHQECSQGTLPYPVPFYSLGYGSIPTQ